MEDYNPFKMLGSYVGAIVFSIYGILALIFMWVDLWYFILELFLPVGIAVGIGYFSTILLHGLFGFILGWGIHSLLRRLKNESN